MAQGSGPRATSARRRTDLSSLEWEVWLQDADTNNANISFDPTPFFNGKNSLDISTVASNAAIKGQATARAGRFEHQADRRKRAAGRNFSGQDRCTHRARNCLSDAASTRFNGGRSSSGSGGSNVGAFSVSRCFGGQFFESGLLFLPLLVLVSIFTKAMPLPENRAMHAVRNCVWAIGIGLGLSDTVTPARIPLRVSSRKRRILRAWIDTGNSLTTIRSRHNFTPVNHAP
jgi:hypothetical protein